MSMSNKSIGAIIKKLNSKNFENIFLQRLSENVEYGIVWHKVRQYSPSKGKYYSEKRDRFYFFKDESDIYVGAVLIMDTLDDLHAFVKKEYRNQGHLLKAMTETILPHLFVEMKKGKQRITIDREWLGDKKYEISRKSALKIGFQQFSESEFYISKKEISAKNIPNVKKYGMTKERMLQLREKMLGLSIELSKISDEFEIKLGSIPEIEKVKEEIKKYGETKLEDEYWKLKGNLNLI